MKCTYLNYYLCLDNKKKSDLNTKLLRRVIILYDVKMLNLDLLKHCVYNSLLIGHTPCILACQYDKLDLRSSARAVI